MWAPEFFKTYEAFMAATFAPFHAYGLDAALRTKRTGRREPKLPGIDFTDEDNGKQVFDAYWQLQNTAAQQLHVDVPDRPNRDAVIRKSTAWAR